VRERELTERIKGILATLSPREEKIIRLRFGIGEDSEYTLEEIGKRFNVSRERIRQIEKKALNRLRHSSRRERLKFFLG
jgi:RNA polymerase primary sigma factor